MKKNHKKYLLAVLFCLAIIGTIITFTILNRNKDDVTKASLLEMSGSEFKTKTTAKDDFILVLYADGCHYCESYMPVFETVMTEYNIKAYKMNTSKLTIDEKSYLQTFFIIEGTPTTVFFKKGEETSSLNRINGAVRKDKIISRLQTMGYIK